MGVFKIVGVMLVLLLWHPACLGQVVELFSTEDSTFPQKRNLFIFAMLSFVFNLSYYSSIQVWATEEPRDCEAFLFILLYVRTGNDKRSSTISFPYSCSSGSSCCKVIEILD